MPPNDGTYTEWRVLRLTIGTMTPTTSDVSVVALAVSSICPVLSSTTASIVRKSLGYAVTPSDKPCQTQRMPPEVRVHWTTLAADGPRATRASASLSFVP